MEVALGHLQGIGILALGSRLRAISEQLYAMTDSVYASHGIALEGRWFPILKTIYDQGPQSVGALATAVGLTHSSISQMASRLTKEGLLTSVPGASDRRVRELALTPKAEELLRRAKPVWRAIREELQARVDAADADVLKAVAALEGMLDGTMGPAITERARQASAAAVEIIPFRSELAKDFYRLNADWLTRYFYLEETDHKVLADPEGQIISRGGEIFFAALGDDIVGTCALLPVGGGEVELTKMGVDPKAQGLGIGRRLIEAAIEAFERRPEPVLFLETNSRLTPAIRMYESVGFEHQPAPRADSHYQRANVYMVWKGRG